jgi:hypothetical protein
LEDFFSFNYLDKKSRCKHYTLHLKHYGIYGKYLPQTVWTAFPAKTLHSHLLPFLNSPASAKYIPPRPPHGEGNNALPLHQTQYKKLPDSLTDQKEITGTPLFLNLPL